MTDEAGKIEIIEEGAEEQSAVAVAVSQIAVSEDSSESNRDEPTIETSSENLLAGEEDSAAELHNAKPEVVAEVVATEKPPTEEKKSNIRELTPEQQSLPWYVVHSYSGFEMRVKLGLEERIRAANVQSKFGNIIVPEEKIVELVRGEKKTSSRKFFPGYILVQCKLDDETWHLVKDTPKVTGFVGDSRNPMPLLPQEVATLMAQMEGGAQRARPRVEFEQGDSIKVIDGPFVDFNGTVDEVKADKGKLRVLISIFGRNTPVELDFVQVEKV